MIKLLRAGVRRYLHSVVFWLASIVTVAVAVLCANGARNFYFEDFYISGIRTTVERLALNVVLQRTIPDRVEIELSARIDVALSDLSSDLSFTPEENLSLLKRIESRRDIAYLDLYYDDGSSDQFYLP